MHLMLEGPAGTGKTLVALQVANNLLETISATAEEGNGPVLVVTTQFRKECDPIKKYLDAGSAGTTKIFKSWSDIQTELGVSKSETNKRIALTQVTAALAKSWKGRQVVLLMDEIKK